MDDHEVMEVKSVMSSQVDLNVGSVNSSDQSFGKERIATPNELVSDYEFVRQLGKGSQGKVFEAVRRSDGLRVAIKQLDIASVKNWKEYELFQRESEVLRSLDHEGIARLYETREALDQDDPRAYIVQQYIDGRTLAAMIKSGYHFSLNMIFDIALQLLDLLEALHKHDPVIIHRDIKPTNIMLEPMKSGYKAYLIDFGAVANPIVQKGGSTVAGTFGYMPPEQQTGRPSAASDIYALGATLAYMLSGVEPSEMPVIEYRLAIERYLESVPAIVVSCIRQMLMPMEADRLCDYGRLRDCFKAFSDNRFDLRSFGDEGILSRSVKEYDKALRGVKRLGVSGNLSLWLELPESTPRALMPSCKNPRWNLTEKKCRRVNSSMALMMIGVGIAIYVGIFCAFNLLTVSVIFGLILLLFLYIISLSACYKLDYISEAEPVISMITPVIIMPILPILGLAMFFRDGERNFHQIKGYYESKRVLTPENQIELHELLTNGRKSMATIVDWYYLPCDMYYVEQKVLDDSYDNDVYEDDENIFSENSIINGYNHAIPTFILRYKFNPPDDSSPNDLYHKVKVHYDPKKYLKKGDMIPILYRVHDNNKYVTSMPYPLPLAEMTDVGDYICETENEF